MSIIDAMLGKLASTPPGHMVVEAVAHVLETRAGKKILGNPALADLLKSTTWLAGELGFFGMVAHSGMVAHRVSGCVLTHHAAIHTANVLMRSHLANSGLTKMLYAAPPHIGECLPSTPITRQHATEVLGNMAAAIGWTKISGGIGRCHERFEIESDRILYSRAETLKNALPKDTPVKGEPVSTAMQEKLITARSALSVLKAAAGVNIFAHHDPVAIGAFAALAGVSAVVEQRYADEGFIKRRLAALHEAGKRSGSGFAAREENKTSASSGRGL